MGLIAHGRYRVGFWMAERTELPELPGNTTPRVEGTRVPGGSTLVLVAADGEGTPVWSLLVHEPEGASLLLPWRTHLVVGLGAQLLFVDPEGAVTARFRAHDEWVSAWPIPRGLLLIGRRGLHLLGDDASPLWRWPFEGDAVHFLDSDDANIRLALMHGEDWREVHLDARTGHEQP